MKLRIRKCDARYVTIDGVESSDTVESLKLKIQEKVTDGLPDGQKLYHAGQLLKDGPKLAYYNIQDDDIIHLWGWLRHTELIKVPPRKIVTVSKGGVPHTPQSEEKRMRKKQMQVLVRSFDGSYLTLNVEKSNTIDNIKAKIQERTGVDPWWQVLKCHSVVLYNGYTLEEYGIEDGYNLDVDGKLLGGLLIKVQTLTGKTVEIDIEPTDTMERVKERVEEREGIPPLQQRLIFRGKQLADDKTVKEYEIEAGTVIHLALALRGGSL